MSHPRWIVSLLSVVIFFANACCLAHQAPQQVAASSTHACCKKKQTDEKHVPSKSCECCRRIVVSIDSAPTHSHAPLLPAWGIHASSDATLIVSHVSCIDCHANRRTLTATDVLQQSCALIL
jgi:hypothetical protein